MQESRFSYRLYLKISTESNFDFCELIRNVGGYYKCTDTTIERCPKGYVPTAKAVLFRLLTLILEWRLDSLRTSIHADYYTTKDAEEMAK